MCLCASSVPGNFNLTHVVSTNLYHLGLENSGKNRLPVDKKKKQEINISTVVLTVVERRA